MPGAAPRKVVSWTREAAEDWDERFGKGSCEPGRIGRTLRKLVEAHGWDKVRPVWQEYLSEKDPTFATPNDFKAKFLAWSEGYAGGDSVMAHNKREFRKGVLRRERGEVDAIDAFFAPKKLMEGS